jgi:succinoglycan biosynthesis protein ExoM
MTAVREAGPTVAAGEWTGKMLETVCIAVPTYRRPDHLRNLLDSLRQARTAGRTVDILVVDNDPDGSAMAIADDLGPGVTVIQESHPGVSAARNRALEEIGNRVDAVIFLDDDEVVAVDWLERLLDYADRSGADVVTGPVLPLFDESTPQWLVRGGFWGRARHRTGTRVESVATNNTVVRTELFRRAPHVRFREDLSLKGGSDTQFFRDLQPYSGPFLWCDEAVVHERLLPNRMSLRWLFRRAMRIGNVNARYADSTLLSFAGGIARIVVGLTLCAADIVRHGHVRARGFNMLGHGVGMAGGVLGLDVVEYKRPRSLMASRGRTLVASLFSSWGRP